MKAKSINANTAEEIKSIIEKSISDGFKPTLAFVFIPFKTEIEPVCEILNRNGIAIFGVSTFGKIIDDPITKSQISALLLDIDTKHFKIFFEELTTQSPELTAASIAKKISGQFEQSNILIYVSDFRLNFTNMLKGFTDVLGMYVNLYGAVAGNDESMTEGFIYTNNQKSKKAVVALAFDAGNVLMKGDAYSGWKSAGTIKTITKSRDNEVLEIDGKPTIDITMKYSGINDFPDDLIEGTVLISRTMSMNFIRENGDPVTLMGIVTTDRSLITHANCPVGTKVQFALPPEFEVVDETINRFGELKQEVPDSDAIIMYSCMSRLDVLGPFVADEVNGIEKLWDAPMAGFMSNGEIGRSKNGELEIHNCATMCIALKEK